MLSDAELARLGLDDDTSTSPEANAAVTKVAVKLMLLDVPIPTVAKATGIHPSTLSMLKQGVMVDLNNRKKDTPQG